GVNIIIYLPLPTTQSGYKNPGERPVRPLFFRSRYSQRTLDCVTTSPRLVYTVDIDTKHKTNRQTYKRQQLYRMSGSTKDAQKETSPKNSSVCGAQGGAQGKSFTPPQRNVEETKKNDSSYQLSPIGLMRLFQTPSPQKSSSSNS
ncbi:hypothetical protein Hamer_G005085, partial [Homarus americanus]